MMLKNKLKIWIKKLKPSRKERYEDIQSYRRYRNLVRRLKNTTVNKKWLHSNNKNQHKDKVLNFVFLMGKLEESAETVIRDTSNMSKLSRSIWSVVNNVYDNYINNSKI